MKKLNVAMAGAMLVVLVAGCSEDKTEAAPGPTDYCVALEETQADFQGFNFLALNDEDFDDLLGKIDNLEELASGESKQAWTTLSTALDDLQSALVGANMSVSDLEGLSRNEVPKGADTTKLAAVTDAIRNLSTDPALQEASATIQQDAQETCDLTLGGTPSPGDTPAS
jgi:hypothetical protein